MSCHAGPDIVENGLVFCYDMSNTQKSWKGKPTTNLVNDSMSIYNNVPGHVTASLTTTGELYQGANIYKLTLTPATSTGVSYLTAGNNPGIGVFSNGGGGLANRYTGHSIFFKPTVPMHSSPIFTSYSNIVGWQSSTNYYGVGDGWYRAHVIWYDTTTRSDGKFWAINPATATINVPIVTYWAGPFKEDRNDSAFVSQYVISSRSNTQAILDLTNNNTITASNLSYNSDGFFSFDGTDDYLSLPSLNLQRDFTLECWTYITGDGSGLFGQGGYVTGQGLHILWNAQGNRGMIFGMYANDLDSPSYTLTYNTWHHFVFTYNHSTYLKQFHADGLLFNSNTGTVYSGTGQFNIGAIYGSPSTPAKGKISNVKIYNRVLSAAEIAQNFNATRRRYGI